MRVRELELRVLRLGSEKPIIVLKRVVRGSLTVKVKFWQRFKEDEEVS